MLTTRCSRNLLGSFMKHKNICYKPNRSAYIVLLPEVDVELADKLLSVHENLPAFSQLTTEKIGTLMGKQILDYECTVRNIERKLEETPQLLPDLFEDVLDPMEKVTVSFDTVFGILGTLYLGDSQIVPPSTYFNLANRASQAKWTRYKLENIYKACKKCDRATLTEEQARMLDMHLFEGKLSALDASTKVKNISFLNMKKLLRQQYEFRIRVETARAQFFLTIDDVFVVKDFPRSLLKLMSAKGGDSVEGPWTVKLNYHTEKFLEYCNDRDLRWLVWNAEERTASLVEEIREFSNSVTLEEIRNLRQQLVSVLGYKNHFEAYLPRKMAKSLEEVKNTLNMYLEVAKPAQYEEILKLQDYANSKNFQFPVQLWDVDYWSRRYKYDVFKFDDYNLKNYLPVDKVLNGLFALCFRLFGIRIQEMKDIDVWHPDVKFYYIYEPDNNKPVSGFYLDLYARDNKMPLFYDPVHLVVIRNSSRTPRRVLPLTSLIMNLPRPTAERPSLMTFSEVLALFGKFGHNLQHLLCKTSYAGLAGLNFVEFDAYTVCYHFMKNWVYDPEVFKSMHGHYETGAQVHELLDLQGVKNHLAGFKLCKLLYKANFDIRLHTEPKKFWMDMIDEMWDDHFVFPLSKYHSDPVRYIDIFAGNWGSSFYSHIWSEMLAADIYRAFVDDKADETNLGLRFKDTFLTFGGSCHSSEIFRRFRGRDPQPRLLLDHLGLSVTESDPSKNKTENPNVVVTC